MAERQTRCLQVAVSLRAWGFKSPLAHPSERPVFLWDPGLLASGDPALAAAAGVHTSPALELQDEAEIDPRILREVSPD